MKMIPVRLNFSFRSDYVSKRGLIIRTSHFQEATVGLVRKIKPAEAPVAFCVRHPRPQLAMLIRLYDGKLWWPMLKAVWGPQTLVVTKKFLELLATGSDILDVNSLYSGMNSSLDVGTIVRSERDEVLSNALRELGEHVLLCGNLVYVPGGEPVYVQTHSRHWQTSVVSIGPDRAIELPYRGLRYSGGSYRDSEVQSAFGERNFQMWDEWRVTEERSAGLQLQPASPQITRLLVDIPCTPPDQIRLDALVRFAACELHWRLDKCPPANRDRFESSQASLKVIAALDSAGPTKSQDRFDALAHFVACGEGVHQWMHWQSAFRWLKRNFLGLAASPPWTGYSPGSLTTEDDDCLAALA